MKTITFFIALLILQASAGSTAHAQAQSTRILDPMPLLDDELFNMQQIEPNLFSRDKTRMKMFEAYTHYAIQQLNDPTRGIGHEETTEAFKDQISSIDMAQNYFKLIRNDYTKDFIDKILADQTQLINLYGYNGKGYSMNLHRMLTALEGLFFKEMPKYNSSDDLKKSISEIAPILGIADAKSSAGDTPEAYAAAKKVTVNISAMYESFHRLSSSDEIFETALMIEFINERLISYGQYDLVH